MTALMLAAIGLALYFLAYRFYSGFIARRIYRLDPDFQTPSHEFEDGKDFVPTRRIVLWGHHFTSIAGAAPIVGPAIAVYWGWLPALLWVVFGTIFFAGVHDFGTLWISTRHKGRSIGTITSEIIGARSRSLFLIVIFLLLLMVNSVFAIIIARLFVSYPGAVGAYWISLPLALGVGWLVYRRKGRLFWPSLVALIVMYIFVWLGERMPVLLPEATFGLTPVSLWVVILFVYCFFASRLPVWLLLQPRDYLNSNQLLLGLAALYAGLLVGNPDIAAPAINADTQGAPPLIPILFITIACGAVSGFHGLVSSGTTAKQLDRETDARFIGYSGALGEGTLALGSILAVTAGLAATRDEWLGQYYTSWQAASGGAAGFFVQGLANLIANLGIPQGVGEVFGTVVVVGFAATTMDTGVRLQRYIIGEIGELAGVPVLRSPTVATLAAVLSCVLLAFGAQAPGGGIGSGGLTIWPLFGTTNQLLAGLSLIVIAVYLRKLGRPQWPVLLPMGFLLVMTIWAMLISLGQWLAGPQPNYLVGSLGLIVLASAIWIAIEAWIAYRQPAAVTAKP